MIEITLNATTARCGTIGLRERVLEHPSDVQTAKSAFTGRFPARAGSVGALGNLPDACPMDELITKRLIRSQFEMYSQSYALDYCGNLADHVASGVLVSCGRSSHSHSFGDRRDCGGNQARFGSRCIA